MRLSCLFWLFYKILFTIYNACAIISKYDLADTQSLETPPAPGITRFSNFRRRKNDR